MSENCLQVPPAVGLQATFASGWVEVLYRVMIHRGLNAQQLFEEAGIDAYQASHAETRFPAHQFKQVWDRAAYLTGDPALPNALATINRIAGTLRIFYANSTD